MVKINLGSHNKKIGDDYINIDGLDLENVNLLCNFNNVPFNLWCEKKEYKEEFSIIGQNEKEYDCFNGKNSANNYTEINFNFKSNIINEIQMIEVLEHISFKNTVKVLKEIYRILTPGGFIQIQVPDCGKAMRYYVNNEICECVPHKVKKKEDFRADKNCSLCRGKGKIHPNRWLYSFTGAQKHRFDAHLNIFTRRRMYDVLLKAGFTDILFENDIYKIKVKCIK